MFDVIRAQEPKVRAIHMTYKECVPDFTVLIDGAIDMALIHRLDALLNGMASRSVSHGDSKMVGEVAELFGVNQSAILGVGTKIQYIFGETLYVRAATTGSITKETVE